jgi:hypothetical protein
MGFEQFVGCCDSLQWVGRERLVGRSSAVIPDFRGSGVITVVISFRRAVVHFNCYQTRVMRGARSFFNTENIFCQMQMAVLVDTDVSRTKSTYVGLACSLLFMYTLKAKKRFYLNWGGLIYSHELPESISQYGPYC